MILVRLWILGLERLLYGGFHIPALGAAAGGPSRSDELTVAVRLQPTGKGLARAVVSPQRRLSVKRQGRASSPSAARPSPRDGRALGRLHRGLKPPGYHRYTAPR
jgi:hypothetical protein